MPHRFNHDDTGAAAAALQDAAIAQNALDIANIKGQRIGKSSTYATLPVTAELTLDDWAYLDTDDVGTGTTESPQYPMGVYVFDGTDYQFSHTLGRDDGIAYVNTVAEMVNKSTFYELLLNDSPAIAGLYWVTKHGKVYEVHDTAVDETLVFRHDVSSGVGLFTSMAEANNVNADSLSPETEGKFSILDQLESLRKVDGSFHFRMYWPELDIEVEWTQTSNPVTSPVNTVTGFVDLSDPGTDTNFLGLAASSSTSSFYDASPATTSWFYSVGAKGLYLGGLPATRLPPRKSANVELYVIG